MSKETSHPTCPFHQADSYVPPRFQQGPLTTAINLGPLALLAGSWKGTGFNTIWRPDNPASQPETQIKRFLELNLTSETLDFSVIPGVVPNRGLNPQTDINLYGLHYLQRVSDADPEPFATAGQALHIEPGLFMNVPASTEPPNGPSIVRMASIPHGVSVLMQGPTPSTIPQPGPPVIPPVYPIPGLPVLTNPLPPGTLGLGIQPIDVPDAEAVNPPITPHTVAIEGNLAIDVAGSQSNGPYNLPGQEHFQQYVNDPNSLLRDKIAHQEILGHITLDLTTDSPGSGIENIPFLGLTNPEKDSAPATDPANAYVSLARSTFWIEWVRVHDGHGPHSPDLYPEPARKLKEISPALYGIEPFWPEHTYLQLQYSQVVILIFNGVFWPHVTVATLRLSAG